MCVQDVHTSIEKAAVDLEAFRDVFKLAELQPRGPTKRTRVTSGTVRVSPDTAREIETKLKKVFELLL